MTGFPRSRKNMKTTLGPLFQAGGKMRSGLILRLTFVLSFTLFTVACATPAVETRKGQPIGSLLEFSDRNDPVALRGWYTLAWGWVVAFAELSDANGPLRPFSVGGLAWFANPLVLTGSVLLRFRLSRAAVACGWLAVGLGLAFLVSPPAEQGRPLVPLVGSYFWVGSLAVFAFGALASCSLRWQRSSMIGAQ